MKKRLIAFPLILSMLLSFAACGQKAAPKKPASAQNETSAAETAAQPVEEMPTSTTQESTPEWVQLYRDELSRLIEDPSDIKAADGSEDELPLAFGLHYLDADSIPELVVSVGWEQCVVYSVIDGELFRYEQKVGWHGFFEYVEKQNTILWEIPRGGVYYVAVYSIGNGKIIKSWEGYKSMDYWNGEHPERMAYEANGESVTPEEYEELYRQNVPKTRRTTKNTETDDLGYELTIENIDLYVR